MASPENSSYKLVLCSGAEHLADDFRRAGFAIYASSQSYDQSRFFSNGDLYTRLDAVDELYDADVCVIQSLTSSGELDRFPFTTSDRVMEVLQVLEILRHPVQVEYQAGNRTYTDGTPPRKIMVLCLHAAFSKQDQIYRTGELNASKYVFDLFYQHGADHIAVIDPHAPLEFPWVKEWIDKGCLSILSMYKSVVRSIKETTKDTELVFVSTPGKTRTDLGVSLTQINKERISTNRVDLKGKLDEHYVGRSIFMLDDVVISGSTLKGVRRFLLDQGAKEVSCWVTHALPFSPPNEDNLRALVKEFEGKIYVSDTVRTATFGRDHKMLVFSCANIVVEFLRSL